MKAKIFLFAFVGLLQSCSFNSPANGSVVLTVMPVLEGSEGEGVKISWGEAQRRLRLGQVNGVLHFSPGFYELDAAVHIKGYAPIKLIAAEGVRFVGKFDFVQPAKISNGFVLHRGDLQFHNFDFSNVGSCITVAKKSTVSNVIINNLRANDVHSCIVVDRNLSSTVESWELNNIFIKGYYRVAVRFAGKGTENIKISNLKADGFHGFGSSHCYKGGVQILQGAHNIDIKNSTISNNVGDCGTSYQQGDGIEIDNKGGVPEDFLFENIEIRNSGDANFDLKSRSTTLKNVISIAGAKTKYAYKIWSYPDYTCTLCSATGEFESVFNINSAQVQLVDFSLKGSKPLRYLRCKETINGILPSILIQGGFTGEQKSPHSCLIEHSAL